MEFIFFWTDEIHFLNKTHKRLSLNSIGFSVPFNNCILLYLCFSIFIFSYIYVSPWVPVITALRVPWVGDGGVSLQIWRLAGNILNKQSWTADQEWSSSLGFGVRLTTSHCKNHLRSETSHRASKLDWELLWMRHWTSGFQRPWS